MPIYDYACTVCDATADKIRKTAQRDDPLACPDGHPMKRTISRGTGFVLKGGGWYKDHYGLKTPGEK